VELARRHGMGLVSIGEITRKQGLSLQYVENILRRLGKAGIVELKRGPGGGCALLRPPEEITAWDVLSAVEQFQMAPCKRGRNALTDCPRIKECSTTNLWKGLESTIKTYLKNITLADLTRESGNLTPDHTFSFEI